MVALLDHELDHRGITKTVRKTTDGPEEPVNVTTKAARLKVHELSRCKGTPGELDSKDAFQPLSCSAMVFFDMDQQRTT